MKCWFFGFLFISFPALSFDRCPIVDPFTIQPPFGYEVSKVVTEKSGQVLKLVPSKDNPYGGPEITWRTFLDAQGRIYSIETGDAFPKEHVIKFELRRFKENQNRAIAYEAAARDSFKLSDKESLKEMINSAPAYNFGTKLSLEYVGDDCFIQKEEEKYVELKSKKTFLKTTFVREYCPQFEAIYNKAKMDAVSCEEKLAIHSSSIDSVFASAPHRISVTSGAGGGGGSPIRSPASINDDQAKLRFGALPVIDDLLKYKVMCEAFKSKKSTNIELVNPKAKTQ